MSPCCRGSGGLCCHLPPLCAALGPGGRWVVEVPEELCRRGRFPVGPPAARGQPCHLCPFPAAVACSALDVPPVPGMSREGPGVWAWPHRVVWLSAVCNSPSPCPCVPRRWCGACVPHLCPGRQCWLSSASDPRCLVHGGQAGCCCPKLVIMLRSNPFPYGGSGSRDGVLLAAPLGSIPSRWPYLLFTRVGREGGSPCGHSPHKDVFSRKQKAVSPTATAVDSTSCPVKICV